MVHAEISESTIQEHKAMYNDLNITSIDYEYDDDGEVLSMEVTHARKTCTIECGGYQKTCYSKCKKCTCDNESKDDDEMKSNVDRNSVDLSE